ncbi:MAG: DUF2252 family protein [Bacteroidetes bacterium]|nr:DUF2252 family protein [Bacteroidota bacterium]
MSPAAVSQRILAFNQQRDALTLPLKYAAMRESSFRFLRGACHLFYEEIYKNSLPASPAAWLCGDLHLENFGSFKGSDRQVYFDINDFDEAILGPALYDIIRLLTSIIVAGSNAGFAYAYSKKLLQQLLESYFQALQNGKAKTVERETATGLVEELFDKTSERKEKKLVQDKTNAANGFSKLINDNTKRLFDIKDKKLKKELIKAIQLWLNRAHGPNTRKVSDLSFAVAGTGSIGTNRYLALIDKPAVNKKYLLIIKQALPSSLQTYVSLPQPEWKNEAERICNIQYRMQHVTPGDLNILSFHDGWYVTRWVQPAADKISFESFAKEKDQHIPLMNTLGELVASAQLRSCSRQGSASADELIAFGSVTSVIPQLIDLAKEYHTDNEKKFKEFCKDYDKGVFNLKNN